MVDLFYWNTVLLQLWFGWFYLTSITPMFYWNYDLADLFYCSTVWWQLLFGWFLLLHYSFVAIIIWLISSMALLFYYNYHLPDLPYCTTVIRIIIWLSSSIAPLFYCIGLADLFYFTTVLLQLWFGWSLLLYHCFIAILVGLISSIPPLFHFNDDLVDFFYSTTALLLWWFDWFLL